MSDTIEKQPGAAFDLTVDAARPVEAHADTPGLRAAGPVHLELFHGMSRLFSYAQVPGLNSGELAVATIVDFWAGNGPSLGFGRSVQGMGDANDGRLHFPPQYAVTVAQQVPTGGLFGAPIPNKEEMAGAFQHFGLSTIISHSAAFGDGEAEVTGLRDWLSRYRIPVACLLDAAQIFAQGQLRWGVVCGWSDAQVLLADEGQVHRLSWQQFRAAWHCPGLPWPNNYMAVSAYLPAGG